MVLAVALLLAVVTEPMVTQQLAEQRGIRAEVVCPDGSRCDLVTDTEAIEVEWAEKWKEAPGQAVLYSIMLDKKPGIILLTKGNNEKINILRCKLVCERIGIRLEVVNIGGVE